MLEAKYRLYMSAGQELYFCIFSLLSHAYYSKRLPKKSFMNLNPGALVDAIAVKTRIYAQT